MEDIINALLDVVRAQHSATEGTDETPFNMDDIVDMAMNLLGRPDEKEEEDSLVDSIQKMVVSLAPDIFPPKTFEEMDDSEKVLSASSMIEKSLMRNQNTNNNSTPDSSAPQMNAYSNSYSYEEDDEEEEQSVGDLNDIIYKSFMEMMGASTPQVEYPFDRSQIRYGREKSVTEMLQEEEEEKKKEEEAEAERRRKLSAWELAQNAIDTDEAAHAKEPYVPAPVEQPKAKSASQMAAEAIRQSEERDRMQLEIERQAEALMAEARRRGQDPMKFMLHQQEILQYMEKNSDELVSFEDYEDLSPEEKLEIERQIHIEKQIAEGVAPDQVDDQVPEEYIPEELKGKDTVASTASTVENDTSSSGIPMSTFDEDTLRALSQQVVSDNSAMILGENSEEDMEAIQMEIFENLKRMMAGAGTEVPPEDIGQLLAQAAENSMANEAKKEESVTPAPEVKVEPETEKTAESTRPLSAVELAMAAQKAAKPEPKEERNTISAADLAKAAQESAKKSAKPAPEASEEVIQESQVKEESLESIEVSKDDFKDNMDDVFSDIDDVLSSDFALEEEDGEDAQNSEDKALATESIGENDSENREQGDNLKENTNEKDFSGEESASSIESMEEEEYEYVDPDELVLGEHTQAEIDEAMENLNTLGLEGEVYERAKRMILLELAGSEAALDAWLFEQENGKKKKATVSAMDEENLDDLSDFDEDLFEKELEMAMDEDFDEEISEDIEDDPEESEEENEEEESEEETLEDGESEEEDLSEELVEESVEATEEESEEEGAEESGPEEDVEEDADQHTEMEEEPEAEPEEEVVVEDAPKPSHKKIEKEKQGKTHRSTKGRKSVVHKKEKAPEKKEEKKYESSEQDKEVEERGYQVSVRKPFVLKNSTSYMNKFEEFITESQENRKLSTGFKKLDSMLRFGLHKGSYFIDAQPQYLKNSFMQQIADRAAEGGVDVLYISTELSRYDLMVDTISRLSYEINGQDPEKAYSVMSIMTGEDGATLESLEDELNWYRGRISEHLFILDQEAVEEYMDSMEDPSAAAILEELIRSIVTEGAHKPVVFIDNIENILSVEDSEDMKPLMEGMKKLAKELGIPIVMSYGYSQAESEEELSIEEIELHESIGNMCDVYLELKYADMITEDGMELTEEDIREMMEDGEKLLIDVLLHRNRRAMRASCQIQGTPRYNYFEE